MEAIKTTYYLELLKRFDTFVIATKLIKSENSYTGNIRTFFLFLEINKIDDLNQVIESTMQDYLGELTSRDKQRGKGKLSYKAINANLSTLRMFSIRMQKEWIIKRGLSVPNNFKAKEDSINGFSLTRAVLTTDEIMEEMERLFQVLSNRYEVTKNRNKAIIRNTHLSRNN